MSIKLSKYVYIVRNYPEPGKSIVFSTLTRMLLILPSKVLSSINTLPEKLERLLRVGCILIDKNSDEQKTFEYWYNSAKLGNRVLMFTVIPVYDCNCQCVYCYADGIKEETYMSKKVCKDFINWVKHQVEIYEPSMLEIVFHGGEPLLDLKSVCEIGYTLSDFTNCKGIKKLFKIVTNGTLLSSRVIEKLVNIPIAQIVITIDGLKEMHNMRRPYKSGKGTFQDIFRNMDTALEKDIEVILGPNIDRQNYQDMPHFLDFLVEKGYDKKKNLILFFSIVMRGMTPYYPDHFTMYQLTSPKEKAQMLISLYKEALIRNLRIANPIGFELCGFKKAAHYIIDPYGKVYRCITTVGRKDSYVGTIYDGFEILIQRTAQLVNLDPWRKNHKCKSCHFLPLCLGGCGQQALLKYGTRNHIDCQKTFINEYLPEALKLAYERSKKFPEMISFRAEEVMNMLKF